MKKTYVILILLAVIVGHLSLPADVRAKSSRILPVRAYAAEVPAGMDANRVYLTADGVTEQALLEYRRELIAAGARSVNLFLPDVIVCELPPGLDHTSLPGGEKFSQVSEAAIVEVAGPALAPGRSGERLSWVKRCYRRGSVPSGGQRGPSDISGYDGTEVFKDVVVMPSADKARAVDLAVETAGMAAKDGRGLQQNAEFWGGDILVLIVLPESNGEYESETANWTDQQVSDVVSASYAAMLDVQGQFPGMSIHYVFRDFPRADTGWEPIKHPMEDDDEWIMDTIRRLDPALPAALTDPLALVHAFNNKQRVAAGTDFVFTGFVANSENAPGHIFHGAGYTAYANLGGPFNITPFPAGRDPNLLGDWMVFSKIFEHETGHVFWTLDEYLGAPGFCDGRSGYLNFANLNKLSQRPDGEVVDCTPDGPHDCIMQDAARDPVGRPWCKWSRGQMGVVDGNGNSIPDIYESAPEIEFATAATETIEATRYEIALTAISTAVPNRNSRQDPETRVDYAAPISGARYAVMGLGEQPLDPVDGRWDEMEEDARLTLAGLPAGMVTVTFRVRNSVNVWSGEFTKRLYRIGVNFSNIGVSVKTNRNRFYWNIVNDEFGATFDVYRLDQGDEMPGQIIASNVQPGVSDGSGFMSFVVDDWDITPGEQYSYYVESTIVIDGRGDPYIDRSSVVEATAMLPIPSGDMVSQASPNPFTLGTEITVAVPPTFVEVQEQSTYSPGSTAFQQRVSTDVEIAVYDVTGRLVKQLFSGPVYGDYVTESWDGTNRRDVPVTSGVYFIRAMAGANMGVRKVVLIR